MALENYSRGVLLTNRFQDQGISVGDIGYIIEVYDDDNYEVEFSNDKGITIAMVVVHANEIEVREPDKE